MDEWFVIEHASYGMDLTMITVDLHALQGRHSVGRYVNVVAVESNVSLPPHVKQSVMTFLEGTAEKMTVSFVGQEDARNCHLITARRLSASPVLSYG